MKRIILGILLVFFMSVSAQAVTLTWDPPDSAEATGVIGYKLYWYKTSEPDTVNQKITDQVKVTLDNNLFEVGEDYTFYVTAYNVEKESDKSESVNDVIRVKFDPGDDILPDPVIIEQPGPIKKITITFE